MVRKFLYAVTIFLVLLIVGAFALRLWGEDLAEVALVPSTEFVDQASLEPTPTAIRRCGSPTPNNRRRTIPPAGNRKAANCRPKTSLPSRCSSSTRPAISNAHSG